MTRAGQFLLYAAALIMPWWVYALMPQYVLFPLTYVLLALVCLFVIDALRCGWQIPFELTLPLAVLAAAAAGSYVYGFFAVPIEFREPLDPICRIGWYLHPFTALATLHFARSKRVVLTTLNILTFSAAAAAGLWLLARFTGLYPTAEAMGIYNWTPPGLPIYALAAALFGAARHQPRSPARRAFGAVAALLALPLLLTLPDMQLPTPSFSMLPASFLLWMAAGYLLEFWPAARIAAKLELARRETENCLQPVFMLSLTALAVLGLIIYGVPVHTEYMLIALAGAWALPERGQAHYAPDWRLAAAMAPLGALIAFNIFRVNPENHLDPRNYAPSFPGAMFDAIDNIDYHRPALETVEARYPEETQTNFWLAHSELFHQDLYAAALQYRQALRPAKKTILPPPTHEQRRAFMDKLRDLASAKPPADHRGAYVLALAGEGRFDEAMSLMRRDAQTVAKRPDVGDSARPVFSQAVQAYLHEPRLSEFLANWPAQDLLALLIAWGGKIEPAPGALPAECLPAVVLTVPGMCETGQLEQLSQQGAVASCLIGGGGVVVGGCAIDTTALLTHAADDQTRAVVVWLRR